LIEMKSWKIFTAVTLAVVVAALFTASAYAYMGSRAVSGTYGTATGVAGTYGYYGGMMGGGMMGGYGNGYGYGYTPTVTNPQTTTPTTQATTTPTTPANSYYGRWGCGGIRGTIGYAAPPTTTATALNITTAETIAQNYVASTGNSNLAVAQVEEYTLNFYVQVNEKNTSFGAFQLLIDKYTGAVTPEMGPNMMWNTKYGMMNGGMMGSYVTTPTTTMPVNVTQAKADAQQFLNTYYDGTTVGDTATFYGYYTIEALSNGSPYGMLSVNGYTGRLVPHLARHVHTRIHALSTKTGIESFQKEGAFFPRNPVFPNLQTKQQNYVLTSQTFSIFRKTSSVLG
jgi:hypothetical protein